jgi:hypothetical protein
MKTIPGPNVTPQETMEQITPPAQKDTPKTIQSNSKRLMSSLGIQTTPDVPQVKPPEEVQKKKPTETTKPKKPIANVTGKAKSVKAVGTGITTKDITSRIPKPRQKPIPALLKIESSQEQTPQVDTGKVDKTFPQTHKNLDDQCQKTETTSDPEAEEWVDIVGGYVRHAKISSKRKHDDTTQKIAPGKPELIRPISPKGNVDKSHPPLPPEITKPPLPTDSSESPPPKSPKKTVPPSIIPSLPKQIVIYPLKLAAANPGVTKSKPHQYSTKKKADATPLRSQQNWAQVAVSPPKRHSLSYTDTPSISDEDPGDLRSLLNERHHCEEQESQSLRRLSSGW